MKVKLRIESPDKAAVEIDKNINSIIGLISTNIDDEILSDDTVNEIIDCIKEDAKSNIANIMAIVNKQKRDYEHKIKVLEEENEKLNFLLNDVFDDYGI